MKLFKALSLTLLFMVLLTSYTVPSDKHVGTWEGIDDKGTKGSLTLKEDSVFLLTLILTDTLSNDVVQEKHRKVSGKYLIDYDRDPISVELILDNKNQGKEISKITGTIRFIGDNRMELRVSLADERSEESDLLYDTIVLDKLSQVATEPDR